MPDIKPAAGALGAEIRGIDLSATLTDDVLRLADSWTKDAVRIEIDPEQAAADSIEQIVYLTTEDEKFKNVCNLLAVVINVKLHPL